MVAYCVSIGVKIMQNNLIIKKIQDGWFILDTKTFETKRILASEFAQLYYIEKNYIATLENNRLDICKLNNNVLTITKSFYNVKTVIQSEKCLVFSYITFPYYFYIVDINGEILDKIILPNNSKILYYKNKENIVYSINNILHIICNGIHYDLHLIPDALILNNNIAIYILHNQIHYMTLENFNVYKKISLKAEYTKINSLINNEDCIFISTDNGSFLIEHEKISKIYKNIEVAYNFIDGFSIAGIFKNLSIVVICHPPYYQYLKSCIDSIDQQSLQPSQKILVLDNFDKIPEDLNAKTWKIIIGQYGHPNKARNIGLGNSANEWVMFFDADNIMAQHYIKSFQEEIATADQNTAFIYKNIILIKNNNEFKHPLVKKWDYWGIREGNFIDTSSVWRKSALEAVGGWDTNIQTEDDYNLVLRLSSQGWSGKYISSAPYSMHYSHNGRWAQNYDKMMDSLFNSYSFTIVSLLAGREWVYDEWFNGIMSLEKPENVNLLVMNDSHNKNFENMLKMLYNIKGFKSISIFESPINQQALNTSIDKHKRVANLYNYILANVKTDFILTVEDDVIIPPNALKDLFSLFRPKHSHLNDLSYYGAVAGLYQSPGNPELAVVALNEEKWENMPKYMDMFNKIINVGFVGGGCTLWFNGILQKVLPMQPDIINGELYGWDSDICSKIRKSGYSIALNGNVICNHKISEC